ncbi:Secreted protein containing C-terminal beta-propeller domain [Halovenus aranensis]|uniref:Secreted protein containing C-terminal beta-propeller domain n=1 Tax=Halovenus aranensis TaxID=890420 RepID=A0A1G8VMG2_9EURY|nr:beta-propeller domain-containing protein [Halovenus aranensis]SDJ67124.1 Secreted protein containing C-terminal beta-propeller domain [Halovenus aranensis]
MTSESNRQRVVVLAVALVGAVAAGGIIGLLDAPGTTDTGDDFDHHRLALAGGIQGATDDPGLETFASADAFEAYFATAQEQRRFRFREQLVTTDVTVEAGDSADGGAAGGNGGAGGENGASGDGPDRHSETNVQEGALDEPDVLKTDGKSVYYAGHRFQRTADETTVLNISDPADPARAATIPASGTLLLVEDRDTLVVFEEGRIWGYDITDPDDPTQRWTERVDASLQTARLYDGSLYLVLVDRPSDSPCPIEPYGDESVACTEVYRPDAQADADAVYTAARVDPATGDLEADTSVVGSTRHSATYVSEDALYLSYTRSTSRFELAAGYITGPGSERLDDDVVADVEELQSLDISQRAKQTELDVIIEDWLDSLKDEKRRSAQRDLRDGLAAYAEENKRNLTTTGIVSVGLDEMNVTATGEVPGVPLNQWSMDEHEGHLRIATTVPRTHRVESVNDVYVLDRNLSMTGSVTGLGETERIYSVRFEGEKGYVVTFRQIDPFYTLDLSDPANPIMEGELKIPGVSHYLHPLDDEGDLVLGVGEEDGAVKLSTFDVSNRSAPVERDVRIIDDERFSEANENHRAFLQDRRHGVFFLPAGEGSYVFSYENGTLEEELRVDIGGPGVRAMYVDNYLYIFGPEETVVVDETNWTVVKRLDSR